MVRNAILRHKWQNSRGQPGSQVNLNSELVRNQELRIPSTSTNKRKIGTPLQTTHDDTITLHQRKLRSVEKS